MFEKYHLANAFTSSLDHNYTKISKFNLTYTMSIRQKETIAYVITSFLDNLIPC